MFYKVKRMLLFVRVTHRGYYTFWALKFGIQLLSASNSNVFFFYIKAKETKLKKLLCEASRGKAECGVVSL